MVSPRNLEAVMAAAVMAVVMVMTITSPKTHRINPKEAFTCRYRQK
jgi:hypothetical protein